MRPKCNVVVTTTALTQRMGRVADDQMTDRISSCYVLMPGEDPQLGKDRNVAGMAEFVRRNDLVGMFRVRHQVCERIDHHSSWI